MTEYKTVAGTTPDIDEQHEARTMVRDGEHMMTEIGDGVFVQWGTCSRCSGRVSECRCASGPVEPKYMEQWRTNRFVDSFKGRGVEPALPVTHKLKDRRVNAVLRLLRSQGWTLTNPDGDSLSPSESELVVQNLSGKQQDMVATAIDAAKRELLLQDVQLAQNAAYGDENDTEINLLRGALEHALSLLGLDMPEGKDPDDEDPEAPEEPDNLTGMDLGDGLSPDYTSEEAGDDTLDASALNGADLAARAAEATEDDLEFARDTLGPSASDDEVQALADDRAARDARELLKEREDQFDAGF